MKILVALASMGFVTVAGCAALGLGKQVPLEDMLVGAKQALTNARELTVFEQFVRYHLLGPDISLYSITSAEFTANTSVENSREARANVLVLAQPQIFPSTTAEVDTTIATKAKNSGTVSITVKPGDSAAYKEIRAIFEKYRDSTIFEVVGKDGKAECVKYQFCVEVKGARRDDVRYAFLKDKQDIRTFKEMLVELDGVEAQKEAAEAN